MVIFISQDNWIGGFTRDGKDITCFHGLKNILEPFFELEDELKMPYLVRFTDWTYSWYVVQTTVWRRRDRTANGENIAK